MLETVHYRLTTLSSTSHNVCNPLGILPEHVTEASWREFVPLARTQGRHMQPDRT